MTVRPGNLRAWLRATPSVRSSAHFCAAYAAVDGEIGAGYRAVAQGAGKPRRSRDGYPRLTPTVQGPRIRSDLRTRRRHTPTPHYGGVCRADSGGWQSGRTRDGRVTGQQLNIFTSPGREPLAAAPAAVTPAAEDTTQCLTEPASRPEHHDHAGQPDDGSLHWMLTGQPEPRQAA